MYDMVVMVMVVVVVEVMLSRAHITGEGDTSMVGEDVVVISVLIPIKHFDVSEIPWFVSASHRSSF